MNSSAFGSRSLSRKGDGSMASNNCFSSLTCTSMTAHSGGITSPAKSLTSALEGLVIAYPMQNELTRHRYNQGVLFRFKPLDKRKATANRYENVGTSPSRRPQNKQHAGSTDCLRFSFVGGKRKK